MANSNPIFAPAGDIQPDVDPTLLRPSRSDLIKTRLEKQLELMVAGQPRWTPIKVTPDGVIVDGHHAVRAAAELQRRVSVLVVAMQVQPVALSILQLPVR